MRLADSGEFALLGQLISDLGSHADSAESSGRSGIGRPGSVPGATTTVGPGDDGAVIHLAENSSIVLTKDLLVDGVHFLSERVTAEDIGHKAIAVNLSDLAAMGAQPVCLLVGLALPITTDVEWTRSLMRGAAEEAGRYGAAIVGGDVTRADAVTISVTAVGTMSGLEPVLRSGASPGDLILVTGSLGASAAGLRVLQEVEPGEGDRKVFAEGPDTVGLNLMRAHLRPTPRLAEGRAAAGAGRSGAPAATAMIDISDGLLQDLGHICEASGLSARLELSALPVSADAVTRFGREEALRMALGGGEDYELIITCAPSRLEALMAEIEVTVIGEMVSSATESAAPPIQLAGAESAGVSLSFLEGMRTSGWDSFR